MNSILNKQEAVIDYINNDQNNIHVVDLIKDKYFNISELTMSDIKYNQNYIFIKDDD